MNKTAFTNYIAQADYPTLFNELGWDKAGPHFNVTLTDDIDETDYHLEAISQKRGFMVYTCHIASIHSATFFKKTDSQLRKYSNDYILIFIEDTDKKTHHLWLTPIKTVEKRNLVTLEYTTTAQTDFLYSKLNDLSFTLDEEVTIVDVTSRVHRAFEVNATRITKDFYTGFKRQHTAFLYFIQGIPVEGDRQLYVSVMLNRLMFCYFIQKKGFLNFDPDYLRHKLSWTQQQRGLNQFYGTFYKGFLCNLFRQGLNAPNHNDDFKQIYGRIPYLNGGLFDVHTLEQQYADIDIADQAFENLFDFFDKWRWHLDTRITASGKDINPDVLGYIFEQYINDRAQMGAYYTKEDITEYIAKNCILPFLIDKITEKNPGNLINLAKIPVQKYIHPAVKKGYGKPLPEAVSRGIDTQAPNLLERRSEWKKPTPDDYALPTEIWRETIERLHRCEAITQKIANGEITHINDFITYNLDIRTFVEDMLQNTDDHLLVRRFYHALQQVTILDPTCGSGAFLFAALNILEPLYEVCIDRMTTFNRQNNKLFVNELQEIAQKYRSNIQYFIYKSIILRNLYGVDKMEEATEIAKLRLFLKMVAVVDVDRRAPNLGLDPLPDIDFNIRCGNTLIGFATLTDATHAIFSRDNKGQLALIFDNEISIVNTVQQRADDLAIIYKSFKKAQIDDDLAEYAKAKQQLQKYQADLNDILNEYLAFTYGIDKDRQPEKFAQWLASHQPFHWFAEFYEIIHSNGGFDVIIGNPPYINKKTIDYKLAIQKYKCSDIYGYIISRCFELLNKKSRYGFIVMHNLAFSSNFNDVRKIIFKNATNTWFSFFARIPDGLFSGDVKVRNCIFLLDNSQNKKNSHYYTTRIHRWLSDARDYLFAKINYTYFNKSDVIPMFNSNILSVFFEHSSSNNLVEFVVKQSSYKLFFKQSAYNWIAVSNEPAPCYDEKENPIPQSQVGSFSLASDEIKKIALIRLNGKLFFSQWLTYGDEFHVTKEDLLSVNIPFSLFSEEDKMRLLELSDDFSKEISYTIQYKLNAGKNVGTFNTSKLWHITDESDRIFLKYLCENPDEVFDAIENHVFHTIKTKSIDEDE